MRRRIRPRSASARDDYIRNTLTRALGEDKAAGLIDRILFGRSSKGLEMLKWMEAREVADHLRNEHPQTIAVVLAYLDSEQSAGGAGGDSANR